MNAEEKSFDFAQEVVKQFITLATGIPALMITFAKDFIAQIPAGAQQIAFFSWGFFAGYIFFGLLALMVLTGVLAKRLTAPLESASTSSTQSGIGSMNVRIFTGCQIIAFYVGFILAIVFGWKSA